MGKSGSPRAERQQQILQQVLAHGSATSVELAAMADVSLMTVHRDIEELTSRGLLRKFHGGVSALPSTVFESSSEYRLRVHTVEKGLIAHEAARYVEPGMSVLLDDSTTSYALANILLGSGPLTVVTNYMPTIELLRHSDDVNLIAIGGDYSKTHDSFLGIGAVEAVEALTVDAVFVSTSAMNDEMTFHQEQSIVQVKRAMLGASANRVLMMDASKLSRTALYRVSPIEEFTTVILGPGSDAATVERIGERTKVTAVDRN